MPDLGFFTLTVAQDMQAQPPVPGEAAGPAPPTAGGTLVPSTAAPGGSAPLGGAAPSSPGNQMFLILIAAVGLMLLFSIMGQRRDRKKREALISAVKKHDRVQTIGGVIGSVVEVKPDYIVLKVDESSNTRITFARSAVQQVLTISADTSGAPAGASEKTA